MSDELEERRGLIVADDITLVRERSRIEDIVGEHVQLKPGGVGSLKGLCPFHDERSPSFQVRPQMGLWHCFGCGEGGDIISFVQKIDALTFAEAVEFLADKAGIQLRYEQPTGGVRRGEDPHKRKRLVAANAAAEEFYRAQLLTPEAIKARQFLAAKGFDRHHAAQFGVGYAPKGWSALRDHLLAKGFTDDELATAGLTSKGARGHYDRFRGRVIWPIRDQTGTTVGFGARKLYDDDGGPKYLNTPESPLYKKAQVLYGLDLAKRAIAQSKRVVIVEGYTDVMAAHLAGETTAVATCGTAFGADHTRLVRRIMGDTGSRGATSGTGEVIFTFDGDAAGQKAALRAFEEDQKFAAQTFVAVAGGGMDPCDLRVKHGDQAVLDLINSRRPLFEFVIRKAIDAHDLTTAEGKVAAVRAGGAVLKALEDTSIRDAYTGELARWVGLDLDLVQMTLAGVAPRRREGGEQPRATALTLAAETERQLIGLVLQHPEVALRAGVREVDSACFSDPDARAAWDAIVGAGGAQAAAERPAAWLDAVLASVEGGGREVVTASALMVLSDAEGEDFEAFARNLVVKVTALAADANGAIERVGAAFGESQDFLTLFEQGLEAVRLEFSPATPD